MALLDYFASVATRRMAREEAVNAIRVKGAGAEQALRDRMARTDSKARRQVYRLAIRALPALTEREKL
ncbi:hypothetical protein HZF05_16985 [Sphingomonas sp. CGMCC 1.13654]|uniref:Uncharacterized protein n=1 Tax=Sphingomonas chungangi TaxID=2683589 RepID=A0A838L9R6_9SPHN|nr:hypothetical protein [Sphingomonas chungangi]MBA2935777.1 hypothetical protein [Sphingomonas chungangi]MVW54468.1 hypothetical protein [Sphingomonas chungangi]